MRRLIPYALLPLALIACALAGAPWLRAFPSAVIAVPLFGAAVLSVLTPMIVVGIGVRRLWVSAALELLLLVFFELFVTLRDPGGFDGLYNGLVHGPSQILTFALPLVSPRTLLVAPVALVWVSGAIIGECVARGWQSVLPYLSLLVTFGLAYAGTARAITDSADGRRYDTLFAATLLLALLLLRAAQAWVVQDEGAESTEPDGILPLRGLTVGAAVAVVVALGAAGLGASPAFSGRPTAPARVPPLDQSRPLTPVSFVAGLRPRDPRSPGTPLFKVSIDRASSSYISLASVDYYDGDGWSFSRTFRPSGGVIPGDPDPTMRPGGKPVTQEYTLAKGALTTAPWMPYLDRAQRVTGTAVDIDSGSGMVVPARGLRAGEDYTVRSSVTRTNFTDLRRSALLGTSAAQIDTALPNGLSTPLGTLVASLARETGVSSDQPVAFLQAVAKDFGTNAALAGGPVSAATTPTVGPSASARNGPSPSPSPSASTHTGGTAFADVLASIRGSHLATPEQFATLTALLARKLNVPARVVSGFRITPPKGSATLPAGSYEVRTAQAWTWVEIPVRGLGWVVLDPSPGTYAGQAPQQSAGARPSLSPSQAPSQNALLTQSNNGGHAVAPRSKTPHARGLSITATVVIVLVVLLLAAAVLVALLLARKRIRVRRRRRTGDPRRRLLGAWQESLDLLVESGLPDVTNLTSEEIAATTLARFGREPAAQARYLGEAANRAIFSPTSWIEPADADAAWRAQAWLSKAVRHRLGWRDRIGSGLRYHRGPRRGPRTARGKHARSAQLRASRRARRR